MRGLAKSVIKENPQNIYEFAAEYFENLLKERDGSCDQSYKKFATYKVYKKNKNARLRREKENSNDVNDVHADNGFRKDGIAVNYGNQNVFEKRDSSGGKSIEEIILPAQSFTKNQSSISSESEINASIKQDASFEAEGPPIPSGNSDDDDVKNMVLDDDMAQAALKIQSTFRGHKTRKEIKDTLSVVGEITSEQVEGEEKEASDTDIDIQQRNENELGDNENVEKSQSDEAAELEGSAVENQNNEFVESETEIASDDKQGPLETEDDDDIANMVLDDDMAQAALKIQSTFRGHKARKDIKDTLIKGEDDDAKVEGDDEGVEAQVGDDFEGIDAQEEAEDIVEMAAQVSAEEVASTEAEEIIEMEAQIDAAEIAVMEAQEAQEKAEDSEAVEEIEKILNSENVEKEITSLEGEIEMPEKLSTEASVHEGEAVEEIECVERQVEMEAASIEMSEEEKANEASPDVANQDTEASNEAEAVEVEQKLDDDVSDMVLDEEMEDAALKIQAAFRGHKVRKETVEPRNSDEPLESSVEQSEAVQEDENLAAPVEEDENLTAQLSAENELPVADDEVDAVADDKAVSDVGNEAVIADQEETPEQGESSVKSSKQSSAENAIDEVVHSENNSPEAQEDEETLPSTEIEEKLQTDEQDIVDEETPNDELISAAPTKTLQSTEDLKENLPEGENSEGVVGEVTIENDDVEKLEEEPTVIDDAEVNLEDPAEDVIELSDNVDAAINENGSDKPQDDETIEMLDEEINVAVVEQEPQKGSNELPNESEILGSLEADDGEVYEGSPVVEELCIKKSIEPLEPDQENIETENDTAVEEGALKEIEVNPEEQQPDIKDNLEELPSGEIEYSALNESISDADVTPDDADNKSRDLTDEKSIDGDSAGSKLQSLDDKSEEIQEDSSELPPQKGESFVRSSTVDDIEMNATQQAHELEQHSNEASDNKTVECILQPEISPIELMDEVVNEYATTVASELFGDDNDEHLGREVDLIKSLENDGNDDGEKQSVEIVDPKLNDENPLRDIEAPKSIDLTQESAQQDELEPINDEILQPEGEDSEIPDETQEPMDANIPTISLEEKIPSLEGDEKLPQDEAQPDPQPPKIDDDVSDMVLDDEMEDAALKIQAAFRGHKVRRETIAPEEKRDGETNEVVIDQCAEENQEQEEGEQQDTSADVEEIQESEAVDQEQAEEGKQLAVTRSIYIVVVLMKAA